MHCFVFCFQISFTAGSLSLDYLLYLKHISLFLILNKDLSPKDIYTGQFIFFISNLSLCRTNFLVPCVFENFLNTFYPDLLHTLCIYIYENQTKTIWNQTTTEADLDGCKITRAEHRKSSSFTRFFFVRVSKIFEAFGCS